MKKKVVILIFLVFVVSGWVHGAIPAKERDALIALYNSTSGENWANKSGWKTPPLAADGFAMSGTEGNWNGITVSNNTVTEIDFEDVGLSGTIPSELGNLSNLQELSLINTGLSGNIPPELGNLINLQTLDLSFTGLSGSIPPELGNLTNLQTLILWHNELSGSIPKELGQLRNLNTLNLSDQHDDDDNYTLTGSIPPELGNLTSLQTLYLGWN